MIEHKSTAAENVAAKEELEATLGLALDHPNIVRTFKYANRELAPTVKVRSPHSLSSEVPLLVSG